MTLRSPVKRAVRTTGPCGASHGQAHGAHGLLDAAAARSRNAGNGHRDVDPGAAPHPLGHGHRHGFADGAMRGNQFRRDVEVRDLRAVAVGHDRAVQIVAAAADVGEPRGHEARRCTTRPAPAATLARAADRRRPVRDRDRRCLRRRRRARPRAPRRRRSNGRRAPARSGPCAVRCSSTWPRLARMVVWTGGSARAATAHRSAARARPPTIQLRPPTTTAR